MEGSTCWPSLFAWQQLFVVGCESHPTTPSSLRSYHTYPPSSCDSLQLFQNLHAPASSGWIPPLVPSNQPNSSWLFLPAPRAQMHVPLPTPRWLHLPSPRDQLLHVVLSLHSEDTVRKDGRQGVTGGHHTTTTPPPPSFACMHASSVWPHECDLHIQVRVARMVS